MIRKIAIAAAVTLSFAGQANASPTYTLQDNFYGGGDLGGFGDVIQGAPNNFYNINSATVSQAGAETSVSIATDYAGHNGSEGTYYGDLLLNPTWAAASRVAANDPYFQNVSYQAGDWSYAVHINGGAQSIGSGAQSGTATLYAISAANIVQSNVGSCNGSSYPANPSCGYYFRQNEAVGINTTGAVAIDTTATWSVDPTSGAITFSFNSGGRLGDDFALSWAETCANDMIQGMVYLPEPTALSLVGAGLIGLAFLRRRNNRKAV